MTQHEKIIEMCSDGEFHCQLAFWNLYIRSPHKRREEVEKKYGVGFKTMRCVHGVKNGYDYRMFRKPKIELPPARKVENINQSMF